MNLANFYSHVVKAGLRMDPRINKKDIHGFEDSGILHGKGASLVRVAMVGIDIEVPELLLAERIRQKEGLDLVIAHHPEGKPFADLSQVMKLQVDVLQKAGMNRLVAEKFMTERINEVGRGLLPANHTRAVDAARILDIPFMCIHTPADNHVFGFIQAFMQKEKPKKLSDIIELLLTLEEFKIAEKLGCGPAIVCGNPHKDVGKILVDMTGGTEGSSSVYESLYKQGIRTIIGMHLSGEHYKKIKDANLNAIIAGHISSDTLGLNLLLDSVEKKTSCCIRTIDCSGFMRLRRPKLLSLIEG